MLKMDSHIHSEYSPDSNSKIDDILKVAKQKNIDVIAISDHNTVDGTKEVLQKTRNTDILAIPAPAKRLELPPRQRTSTSQSRAASIAPVRSGNSSKRPQPG